MDNSVLLISVVDMHVIERNVGRAATSERLVQDLASPDRRTPMEVLVKKTFTYVNALWAAQVQNLLNSL